MRSIQVRYNLEQQKYMIYFPDYVKTEVVTNPEGGVVETDDIAVGEPIIVHLDEEDATGVVKALIKQGIEIELPQSETFLSGKLEATEKHLSDMRRLVMMENEKGQVE